MLHHAVYCAIRPDVPETALAAVMDDLRALGGLVDGMLSFHAGPNRDFEAKSQGFSHGFVIRFRDHAALQAYAIHPAHRAAGARLVALCQGGADGIMVFDLETAD